MSVGTENPPCERVTHIHTVLLLKFQKQFVYPIILGIETKN